MMGYQYGDVIFESTPVTDEVRDMNNMVVDISRQAFESDSDTDLSSSEQTSTNCTTQLQQYLHGLIIS